MFSKATIESLRGALRTRLTGDSATDCFLTKEDVEQLVETTPLSELQIKRLVENFRFRVPMAKRASSLDGEEPEEVMTPYSK